jgi:hypothetical protein
MRACTRILSNRMLQPTQPAGRAVGASGLRRSTADKDLPPKIYTQAAHRNRVSIRAPGTEVLGRSTLGLARSTGENESSGLVTRKGAAGRIGNVVEPITLLPPRQSGRNPHRPLIFLGRRRQRADQRRARLSFPQCQPRKRVECKERIEKCKHAGLRDRHSRDPRCTSL